MGQIFSGEAKKTTSKTLRHVAKFKSARVLNRVPQTRTSWTQTMSQSAYEDSIRYGHSTVSGEPLSGTDYQGIDTQYVPLDAIGGCRSIERRQGVFPSLSSPEAESGVDRLSTELDTLLNREPTDLQFANPEEMMRYFSALSDVYGVSMMPTGNVDPRFSGVPEVDLVIHLRISSFMPHEPSSLSSQILSSPMVTQMINYGKNLPGQVTTGIITTGVLMTPPVKEGLVKAVEVCGIM